MKLALFEAQMTINKVIGKEIDELRLGDSEDQHRAYVIQFDDSGRCKLCKKLRGGNPQHRCWADTLEYRTTDAEAYANWRQAQDESKTTRRESPYGVNFPELTYRAWVELGRPIPHRGTIHILHKGQVLCGTLSSPPGTWPPGHVWLSIAYYDTADSARRCAPCFEAVDGDLGTSAARGLELVFGGMKSSKGTTIAGHHDRKCERAPGADSCRCIDRTNEAELVDSVAQATPYHRDEVQRAHDHLKLAIEAAATIAQSQNRTLDSAAHIVGAAIKDQAQAPGDVPHLVGAPVEFRSADGKLKATARVAGVEVHPRPYSIDSRRALVDHGDDDTGEQRCNNPDCPQCNPSAASDRDYLQKVYGTPEQRRDVAIEELERRRREADDRTCPRCGSQLVDTATPADQTPTPGRIDKRECPTLGCGFQVSIGELQRLNDAVAELRRRELSTEPPVSVTANDLQRSLSLNSTIHLAELGMMHDRVSKDIDKHMPDEAPDVWKAGFRAALVGVRDALRLMIKGWRKNVPQSRAAEIILNGEEPDQVEAETTHILQAGTALCGKLGLPGEWTDSHKWVSFDDQANLVRERESGRGCVRCFEKHRVGEDPDQVAELDEDDGPGSSRRVRRPSDSK